ncbi:hypothetical protein VUR80DRAFT_3707 [Thermomyces stellatus]
MSPFDDETRWSSNVCELPCTALCENKGHVVVCPLRNHSYRPGNMCVTCKNADKRAVAQERKEAEKRSLEKEKENSPEPKERKKASSPDKLKRKQEEGRD